MAFRPMTENNDETVWNLEKWVNDVCNGEGDDKLIEDANRSVDEVVGNDHTGLDNEVVNLGTNATTESGVINRVSQNSDREAPPEVVVTQPQATLLLTQPKVELPAFVEDLLNKNEPSSSGNITVTDVNRNRSEGSGRKTSPRTKQVQQQHQSCQELSQPQTELPDFVEGLLKINPCSSGKRKAGSDGNNISKTKSCRTVVKSKGTKQQLENTEELERKKQEKKEREKIRAKENRDKKKQLEADNVAKRISLSNEVSDLKAQMAEKDNTLRGLNLQIEEKDAEIFYLKQKVKRLELEKGEKDAEIIFLKKRFEHHIVEETL